MRILKLTAIALSALLASQTSFSQVKREIITEDPKQAPNLRIDITPLSFNSTLYETYDNVEFGIRGMYRINNRFNVSAELRKEIVSIVYDENNSNAALNKSAHAIDVSGTYYFLTKEKEFEERLKLKTRSAGYNTVEVLVDDIPTTKMALYGARVGYLKIKCISFLTDATLVPKSGSGATLKNENAYPMQTTGIIYAGISATRIRNLKVKYPVYGTRRRQFVREYYLDFMYGANNEFSTVMVDNGTAKSEYNVTLPYDISKIGARIGLFNTSTGKTVNLGWGMEIGYLPRSISFSSGLYWNFKFAIPLAFNLNKSE